MSLPLYVCKFHTLRRYWGLQDAEKGRRPKPPLLRRPRVHVAGPKSQLGFWHPGQYRRTPVDNGAELRANTAVKVADVRLG